MDGLQFTILDPGSSLTPELKWAFEQHLPETIRSKFIILQITLAELKEPYDKFDCIVSPANSYGRLDGGFDWFISEALAPPGKFEIPTQLAQATLYKQWRGYAPPGTCTLVPLLGSPCENNANNCAYIALCPTMRIPELVKWNREIVYNCIWSLLVALTNHNAAIDSSGNDGRSGRRIQTVLMTGLATGIGGVSPERYAQQMALAVRDFVNASNDPKKWSSLEWDDALQMAGDARKTHDL